MNHTSTIAAGRLQALHPAWGAGAMSLGGLAFFALRDPLPGIALDLWAGVVALVLAVAWVLALTVANTVRIARMPDAFLADLRNPGMGALVATWPASFLIVSLGLAELGTAALVGPAFAFWTGGVAFGVGLLGTLAVGFAFYSGILHGEVPPMAMTGNWFVPVVPLVLGPSVLVRLFALSDAAGTPMDAASTAVISIGLWGTGFFLFLLLAAIIGNRLLVSAAPPAHQAPSWLIWLAPLGVGGLGLIAAARTAMNAGLIEDEGGAVIGASALWGVALWWALLAIRVLLGLRRDLSFHLGWWGFGFPAVAFGALTLELGRIWGATWMAGIGTALWIVAAVLVLGLLVLTLRAVFSGVAWRR